jgi:hypothetical protein
LKADASVLAKGPVLMQINTNKKQTESSQMDDEAKLKTIGAKISGFAQRVLQQSETQYLTYDKDFLAIV